MYAGQNNEHDYLDYGYASLEGLVSLNRTAELSREDSLVILMAFECIRVG